MQHRRQGPHRRSICSQDRIGIVLDDKHRIALIAKLFQRVDQLVVVGRMEPDRRLVEHIDRSHEACAQFGKPDGPVAIRRR